MRLREDSPSREETLHAKKRLSRPRRDSREEIIVEEHRVTYITSCSLVRHARLGRTHFRAASSRPSSTWAAAPHIHRRFIGPCVIIDKHTHDTDPASLPQERHTGGSVGVLSLAGLRVRRGPGEAQGESNGRIMQLNVPNRRLTPVDKYTGINILGSG